MLNGLSVFLEGADAAGRERVMRAWTRQGFAEAARFAWPGGDLVAWAHPSQRKTEDCFVEGPEGVAFCVGPLWYRGQFGRAALVAMLEEVRARGCLDETGLRGNFALFLQAGEHVWLFNDALGFVRIHGNGDACHFSTSWLAACAYLSQVDLQVPAAIEYVLLGAVHARQSVVKGVESLALGHGHDLQRRRTWSRFASGFGTDAPDFETHDIAVAEISASLGARSAEVAAAFPGRVNTALSGGFDSRLIVAGMLASGVTPHLFVYGNQDSSDVVVARRVAEAMGLELDIIDKSVMDRDLPAPDLDALESNALFFDGLPSDGIFDPGSDRLTRLQQNADGAMALNGGGGEIFRNFFHLPDGRFRATDIVRSFYRGFSDKVFRGRDGLRAYQTRLAAAMCEVLGVSSIGDDRLTRRQVELLYPLFRCHYWMGVNNSVAVRHGHYATPLLDAQLVHLAQRVPLRWKQAGAFESRLIANLHPGIAAVPGSDGFRFSDGPDRQARMTERMTCARPTRLRPLIGATRRRLHKLGVTPDRLRHFRQLLPGAWLADAFLDLAQLPDDHALGRAFALEFVFRRLL